MPSIKRSRILISITILLSSTALGNPLIEDRKFTANDGVEDDLFGWSIAIDNDIVAVGSNQDDDNGPNSGSAYLFSLATGSQLIKLVPHDGGPGDNFGRSIAIDNGIVAVGAYSDDAHGISSGSAYLYNATTGELLFKLSSRDHSSRDYFGTSIAIHNNTVAVGADGKYGTTGSDYGSAYLFNTNTGTQTVKLLSNDIAEGDCFGHSIALHNNLVAVGAYLDDDNGSNSGSAYIFDAATGNQLFKLLPNDGSSQDRFGKSIAIENGIVAVGAYLNDDFGSNSGSVYLFDANTGTQIAKITPDDIQENHWFGWSVAMDTGILAVGSLIGNSYLFDANTGTQINKLLRSDGSTGDQFGRSIATNNGQVAVGATFDNDNGNASGSAYYFNTNCPADLTADGLLDLHDISTFISMFSNGSLAVDFNNDGTLDFFDVTSFLAAFALGCP